MAEGHANCTILFDKKSQPFLRMLQAPQHDDIHVSHCAVLLGSPDEASALGAVVTSTSCFVSNATGKWHP
jgi:hypothetical protein